MRRQLRSILPSKSDGRVLRFSGPVPVDAPRTTRIGTDGDEDNLHRALGRIAANWSLIEIASGLVLMGLVGSRDEALARAVVAGQRVENVWETIEALLSSYGEEPLTSCRSSGSGDGVPTSFAGAVTRPSTAPGR